MKERLSAMPRPQYNKLKILQRFIKIRFLPTMLRHSFDQ